jgi:5-methylcytosine-specific restriction endonuclease McrA
MSTIFKKCSVCSEEKPATSEYYHKYKRGLLGLQPHCKVCDAAKGRAYTEANREAVRARNKEYYLRVASDLSQRTKNKRKLWTPEQLAAERERRTRWREANRERFNAYMSAYRAANPSCRVPAQHKRRALARAAGGTFSIRDVEKLHLAQNGRCWWCQTRLVKYHVDHRIPLARGGSNGVENLVLSCPPCNLTRHDKLPWESNSPRLI